MDATTVGASSPIPEFSLRSATGAPSFALTLRQPCGRVATGADLRCRRGAGDGLGGGGVELELDRPVVDWIWRRGHDVLGHGWRWLEHWEQTREEEREHLRRAISSYERTLGFRPLGWNCRSWPSEATRELLIEEGGFLYDSDGYGDDLPYYTTSGDRQFLIVPYSKVFNDGHYLGSPGYSSPDDLQRTLARGLDELAGEDRVSMMTAAFHARWSGYPGRASVVSAFIDHARRTPGVTFMRRDDIARWWHERYAPV